MIVILITITNYYYNKVYLKMNTSYNVSTPEKLYHAESIYHVMEIYVWLSNKYGLDVFPDKVISISSTNTNISNTNTNISKLRSYVMMKLKN